MNMYAGLLHWVFMLFLQHADPQELIYYGPISYQAQTENTSITITRLEDPAEDYWTITADMYVKGRLAGSQSASGFFSDEGMLLFSLTDDQQNYLFSVNDAGGPLVLQEILGSHDSIYLTADGSRMLDYSAAEDDPISVDIYTDRTYTGDGITVSITFEDRSIDRVLYSFTLQIPGELDIAFIRKE